MLIKEFSLQNFKSFGNNKQTIKLNIDGGLILLSGDNGNGKSSLQESIDFSLFGLVRGKERKRIPQKELPNRINGSLLSSVKFINDNNDDIYIERGLKPSKLQVLINSNDITNQYKEYTTDQKESIIGMNYDVYKSFISMSLNDFSNFINLDPETKRKLLNKLFNLERLDKYYIITKDIIKDNINNIVKIEMMISNNNISIESYKNDIIEIKKLHNNYKSKNDIKEQILSKKSLYDELKEKIKDYKISKYDILNKLKERKEIIQSKNNRLNIINLDIKNIIEKINVYDNGICPLCGTELKTNKNLNNKLLNEKHECLLDKQSIQNEIIEYRKILESENNEYKKIVNQLNKTINEFNILNNDIFLLKKEYKSSNIDNDILDKLNKNIKKLELSNNQYKETLEQIKNDNVKYLKLNKIFSVNGLRKTIIKNTVKPINNYLKYYLKKLESTYHVVINDEFNADIFERQVNKIHSETLSLGESRKINIAIVLSYLEIIRKIRTCNLLFLDELFAGIDVYNVDLLLKSLKKFAKKYKINIIVVNHTLMNVDNFDRIIDIKKDIFSMINDKYID